MNQVFVDSWAWFALTHSRSADHVKAQQANDKLLNAGYRFVTTNFVLAESTTLIRYQLAHATSVQFLKIVDELVAGKLLSVIRISELHEQTARSLFERYSDQDFSFADCTSFAVMRELEIEEVFTGDKHFATMGFRLMP